MEVEIRREAGYEEALEGIGYSFGVTDTERLKRVAAKLAGKDGGHNKFLESMVVWFRLKAPRHFWQEFDTYRVGTTKQSESTIHTIAKKPLTQDDFCEPVLHPMLDHINSLIGLYNSKDTDHATRSNVFALIKANLPEGYMQARMVCTNYKVLKNMFAQRKNHRLIEWHIFIDEMCKQLKFPQFIDMVLE